MLLFFSFCLYGTCVGLSLDYTDHWLIFVIVVVTIWPLFRLIMWLMRKTDLLSDSYVYAVIFNPPNMLDMSPSLTSFLDVAQKIGIHFAISLPCREFALLITILGCRSATVTFSSFTTFAAPTYSPRNVSSAISNIVQTGSFDAVAPFLASALATPLASFLASTASGIITSAF